MTRQELCTAIKVFVEKQSFDFKQEMLHFMDVEEREYEYDEFSAVLDILDMEEQTPSVIKACHRLLIAVGYYRAMTQEEVDNTYASNGCRWDFKLDKVPYERDTDFPHEQFPE